jgi:outer membrane immunogenic protein
VGGGWPYRLDAVRSAADVLLGWLYAARFDQINLFNTAPPAATLGLNIAAHTYSGWFLGSGYEYAVGWLPGLTWKTEYRFAEYQTDTNTIRVTATGLPSGFSVDSQKWVNTIRSELVYRFGGWR